MFKKLIVAILLVGLLVFPALAQVKVVILPPGPRVIMGYDFTTTHKLWDGIAIPLAGINELFYFELGGYSCIKESIPMVGFSANILNLLSLIPRVELKFDEPFTLGISGSYDFQGKWMGIGYVSIKLPLGTE